MHVPNNNFKSPLGCKYFIAAAYISQHSIVGNINTHNVYITVCNLYQINACIHICKYKNISHGRCNGLYNVYAIILRGSRGPDPLNNKKVFAGSDYLTASTSRRYFTLGGILVQEKWTKLLKPGRTYHGNFFGIGSSYGRPIYSPFLHFAILVYQHKRST